MNRTTCTLADEQVDMARRMLRNANRQRDARRGRRWVLRCIYGPLSLEEVIGCPSPTTRPYKLVASRNKREGRQHA